MTNGNKYLDNKKTIFAAAAFMVFFLMSGFVGFAYFSSTGRADGWVENLRFGVHPDKTRIVLDMSVDSEYRAFILADPYRVVVDFPDVTWQSANDRGQGVGLVNAYRYGAFDSHTTRLVLDTSGPAMIGSMFTLPRTDGEEGVRLVIDLVPAEATEVAEAAGEVWGELVERDVVQPAMPDLILTRPARDRHLIVVDAGHGGVDPGAIAENGITEKNITLAVAQELKIQLEATGRYDVLLTRDSNVFIPLRERVRIARAAQADLFISLHADSIDSDSVHGLSVYTLSENASDREAGALAARENRSDVIAGINLDEEYDDVANFLIDLAMRETMNQSKRFANMLVDQFAVSDVDLLDNTHRYAGFAVLKAPDIPSVLVEMGFVSNANEVSLLTTETYQRKIAGTLTNSIDRYFNWLELAQNN